MHLRTFFISKDETDYKEIYVNNALFEKFYEIDNPSYAECIGIPDGSIDIQCLWQGGKMKVYVAGSFVQGGISLISKHDKCFGARFHTGVLPQSLRGNISNIINNRVGMDHFLQIPHLEEKLKINLSLHQKAECIMELFENVKLSEEKIIIKYLVNEIKKNNGCISVRQLIADLGYSHRYSDHVFKTNTGFSIKKYANIVRLQKSIRCVLEKKYDDIYDRLGYYDQAHFIRDFKKFTSLTPKTFNNRQKNIQIV